MITTKFQVFIVIIKLFSNVSVEFCNFYVIFLVYVALSPLFRQSQRLPLPHNHGHESRVFTVGDGSLVVPGIRGFEGLLGYGFSVCTRQIDMRNSKATTSAATKTI